MQFLDMSLEPTIEARIKQRYAMPVMNLHQKLNFTTEELEVIVIIYHKIMKNKEGVEKTNEMTQNQFRQMMYCALDMTDDTLSERLFAALDHSMSSTISLETFANTIHMWIGRGTMAEKIAYCFAVYDTMGDGLIRREAIFNRLRESVIKPTEDEADEAVRDLVDIIMKRMDADRDGMISFEDYSSTVYESPLMLEVMGECLPKRNAVFAFLTSCMDNRGAL